MRPAARGAFLLLLLLPACARRAPEPFTAGAERYRFEVTAEALSDPGRAVAVSVRAVDLESGRSIQADPVTVPHGGSGRGESFDADSGATITVDVAADPAGRQVRYTVEVRREGRLVASRGDTIRLTDGRP